MGSNFLGIPHIYFLKVPLEVIEICGKEKVTIFRNIITYCSKNIKFDYKPSAPINSHAILSGMELISINFYLKDNESTKAVDELLSTWKDINNNISNHSSGELLYVITNANNEFIQASLYDNILLENFDIDNTKSEGCAQFLGIEHQGAEIDNLAKSLPLRIIK
jgi:Mg2+ and Co2+ transporter CorA